MNIQQIEDNNLINLYGKREVALVRGEGVYLFDENGKKYLDLASNYGANVLGYSNNYFEESIKEQVSVLTNCHSSFYNDTRAKFLEKLHTLIPQQKSFLCSTGTESTEAALKFARVVTGRIEVISSKRGYHGRTMGALSATAIPKYQKSFLPLVPGFKHVSYNDIESIKEELNENVAAVIMEPIQGEGGVFVPDNNYLKEVKKLCEENGTLLILDEVQTCLRTGNWLRQQDVDVVADIVCMSKGLGNGFPVAVTSVTAEVAEKIPRGVHGTTFGSNPLACRAALATLEEFERNNLHESIKQVGKYFMDELKGLECSTIREVRGAGLMIAVELKQKAGKYVKLFQDNGLLVMCNSNILRLLPPLVIKKEEVDEAVKIIREILCNQK